MDRNRDHDCFRDLRRDHTMAQVDKLFLPDDQAAGHFTIAKIVGQRELDGSMGIRKDETKFSPLSPPLSLFRVQG